MHLVLDTHGIEIKVRNACFFLKTAKHERIISPLKISGISVVSQCMLSTAAVSLATKHHIPIYFYNTGGQVEASLWSASFGRLADIRRKQVLFGLNKAATQVAIGLLNTKTIEQIENLEHLALRKTAQKPAIAAGILKIKEYQINLAKFKDQPLKDCAAELMGTEGSIARQYWACIAAAMPGAMQFNGRSRRPAQDYFNAALNYLYGMLYGKIENAIFIAGMDPFLGLLHADDYNKPTFVYDLIEPFRPWVDRLLLNSILANEISEAYFMEKNQGYWLSKPGKRYFIPLFDEFFAQRTLMHQSQASRTAHIYRYVNHIRDTIINF